LSDQASNQPLGMKKIIRDEVIKLFQKIPLATNLARKKFISSFLLGIIDREKVQFREIALHIESEAKIESIERNIQSFFKDYEFDYDQVCLLLVLFLPRGKLSLSIDRTEWDFGVYHGAARAVQYIDDSSKKWLSWNTFILVFVR